MGSPSIKEDPCCAVASAKKPRKAGLLHGAPSSSGPRGQCVLIRSREAQLSGGDQGDGENTSGAASEVVTPELKPMVALLTCSPSEK